MVTQDRLYQHHCLMSFSYYLHCFLDTEYRHSIAKLWTCLILGQSLSSRRMKQSVIQKAQKLNLLQNRIQVEAFQLQSSPSSKHHCRTTKGGGPLISNKSSAESAAEFYHHGNFQDSSKGFPWEGNSSIVTCLQKDFLVGQMSHKQFSPHWPRPYCIALKA